MMQISININGVGGTASIEPRTTLADFIRDQERLTGIHLGCEQGVCGACTIMVDGLLARSCIIYAVSCDGAKVQTIENYDNDPIMAELREAFTANHGLQCGYCTPAMLMTARDIITRLPQANIDRVRLELAGNLCRCTGYGGIVRAIMTVLEEQSGENPSKD